MKDLILKVKSDFITIMMPGLYLLFGFIVCLTLIGPYINKLLNLHLDISILQKTLLNKPSGRMLSVFIETYMYLFAFFLVYLIGHALRAIPVEYAEKESKKLLCDLCKIKRFFKKCSESNCIECCKKNGLAKHFFFKNEKFPYGNALKTIIKNLNNKGFPEEIFSFSNMNLFSLNKTKKSNNPTDEELEHLHIPFNFFKVTLCAESANTFIYTQTLEARVRLFAGMFWAGIGNLFLFSLSIFIIILCNESLDYLVWIIIFSILTILITLIIAFRFPWIRGQEVEYVFLSYLALLSKQFYQSRFINEYNVNNNSEYNHFIKHGQY